MTITEIIKDYLTRFPDLETHTLARTIYENHKHLFKDKEIVRSRIRYYRGKSGQSNRSRKSGKLFADQQPIHRYNIQDSRSREWTPYILPKAANNILIINDLHFPYHDPLAIEVALDWGVEHGINTILLNGDILDFYQLSKYVKDPSAVTIKKEIEMLRDFLQGLHEQLPNVKVYYKMGNHEERFENYMKVKAPELWGMEEFRLDVILHLAEYGVEYITDKRMIMAGKLPILHGHELNGISSTVNPARGLYMKAKSSSICAHLHRSSEHNDVNISSELSSSWSIGCLCDLHPEYAPYNSWNHGFCRVKVAPDGTYKVFNARMYDYQVL